MSSNLCDRCHINSNFSDDKFVGIKFSNVKTGSRNIYISFPMGYRLEKTEDAFIRREILSLLMILQKFCKQKDTSQLKKKDINLYNFPVLSYQYLIFDFLNNGYYTEMETIYSSNKRGKINWKRTIQNKLPYYKDNKVAYLDFVIKSDKINTNQIITLIHEYCVYESFMKLGWLYTSTMPQKPRIKLNKSAFIAMINESISQTFNDNKIQLFKAMLSVINNASESNDENTSFSYGTSRFEYTWENMIDFVFGIDKKEKERYFPKARWKRIGKSEFVSSNLRPDTIIEIENKIYIIDAKYYKYGLTENDGDLPSTSSIQKQITYGEFLTSEKSIGQTGRTQEYDKIYNAFIIPFDKKKHNDEVYKSIGVATADWKDNNNSYEYVLAILLDTKHLMQTCYRQNSTEIERLTCLIEEKYQEVIEEVN